MKHKMVAAIFLYLLSIACAHAGLDEGKAAYSRGDFTTAFREFKPLAGEGNAEAQFSMANMYRMGKGINKDDAEAVKWLRKASDQGHVKAQFVLGLCYSLGSGVRTDQAEAAAWYRKAADQGYAPAQFEMGARYELGRGVNQDKAEAVK